MPGGGLCGGGACTAIILAGGSGSRLHPLNDGGLPKVLMPVANRPLLTFPLRTLEEGGVSDVLVVSEGQAVGGAVGGTQELCRQGGPRSFAQSPQRLELPSPTGPRARHPRLPRLPHQNPTLPPRPPPPPPPAAP